MSLSNNLTSCLVLPGKAVTVNGIPVTLPKSYSGSGLILEWVGLFVSLSSRLGVTLLWDGGTSVVNLFLLVVKSCLRHCSSAQVCVFTFGWLLICTAESEDCVGILMETQRTTSLPDKASWSPLRNCSETPGKSALRVLMSRTRIFVTPVL